MKKRMIFILPVALMLSLAACSTEDASPEDDANMLEEDNTYADTIADSTEAGGEQEDTEMKLRIDAGGSIFTASFEDNDAAAALADILEEKPMVIEMDDYSGFEKVGSLGTRLPASNSQMTTRSGDIVLYNGSQIVMFYGSNSWSYTKLAEVDDLTGWEEALGSGSITVTLSVE